MLLKQRLALSINKNQISPAISISKKEAQQIALLNQGLLHANDTLTAIQQIGYVQIDTISVTERAHNHVLFSRNKNFNQHELFQLMEKKAIFEYWSHAAAYLPMEDYRFSLYRKEQYKAGDNHWFPRDKKVEQYVLDRIKAEGPLQSKDFDNPRNKNHEWYEWKPAKIALTNLFMDGSLMISNRKGFQKIFDITERVIPNTVNTSTPTKEDYCKHLILNAIKTHGLVTLNEICYLRKGIKPVVKQLLAEMLEKKELISITIAKNDNTYCATNQHLESLKEQPEIKKQVHILNPFDNLVIQRQRLKELFNFDYQIECYVPEKKRKFGYYTLPIMYGNSFVARMDAKADRKKGVFHIKGIWLENNFKPTTHFKEEFLSELQLFANFCGCTEVNGQLF